MVDITQATDTDIQQSVDAFSAALRARAVNLRTPRIERILLAVDHSNQGETAERLAAALARAHQARIILLYAYEGRRDAERESYLSARARALEAHGISLEPMEEPVRTEHGLRSFEQILETCAARGPELIIVPAPYLDDYTKLGDASVGANLDVLMRRAHVPLLVVRKPGVEPEACLANALLPITPYGPATAEAAAWMLTIVRSGANLRLLASVEHGEMQDVATQSLDLDLPGVDAEKLAGLRRPELAGLIAELQRRTAEAGLGCRLMVRGGDALETTRELANDAPGLLVLASCAQPFIELRNLALVRCSTNPVLIVGGGPAGTPQRMT